jgi:hypothetical protein
MRHLALGLPLVALTMLPRPSAGAPDTHACIAAAEHGQELRERGKLSLAKSEFILCAAEGCPAQVRKDCTDWLAQVDASLSSVVVVVRSPAGSEAAGARVWIDGVQLAADSAGRSVTVDPGVRKMRVELEGATPLETDVVVHEGEKNRIVAVQMNPASTPAPPERTTTRAPVPLGAYVAGGVALVGFASFAYFGLSGTHDLDDLRSSCVHACSPSSVDAARRKLLVGDLSLLAGLASAGIAAWLVLGRGEVRAAVAPVPHGALAAAAIRF